MIAEIRKHIRTQIKAVSKQYQEINNPFGQDDEMDTNKTNYTYSVVMGTTTPELNNLGEEVSSISVNLKTYREGDRDKNADFDEGYCQALLIGSQIVDISKYNSAKYILSIVSGGVTPIEVTDSQNVYAYENTLIFKISYGIGE